ncbi:hypothetical protein AeRB84_015274 [Aphanomyces euteiches]|nr:hypothetical protein AeRB84_015274 [Aphanomyces euteiches]
MAQVPSKETIEESFHGASTRKVYKTYQNQFVAFCKENKRGLLPEQASAKECTDFFHYLYSNGKSARTIDSAKAALVAFFTTKNITPNQARDAEAKRYVVGLQKYNKLNNLDEVKKAHPLSVFELSAVMNAFAVYHPFVGALYRFMFCGCFLGCFRISEMLNLRWNDVDLGNDENGQYLSVRLRWHKKASVEDDCQIYHLVDEKSYPCLKICGLYSDYLDVLQKSCSQISQDAFVFPHYTMLANGILSCLQEAVQNTPYLPIGISLHSMRRGCNFFRVFEWSDAKTLCEYLVTRSISNEIDPRILLHSGRSQGDAITEKSTQILPFDVDSIATALYEKLEQSLPKPSKAQSTAKRQESIAVFLNQKSIPTARSAKDVWQQWITADPKVELRRPLKDFTKSIILSDRNRYSERQTIALAFSKYQDLAQFEAAYAGYTDSYAKLLHEVRKRKRSNCL